MSTSTEPLYTEAELAALCRSGTELMDEALASGNGTRACETYARQEDAMRAFCLVYGDWLVLTHDYLIEVLGHEQHARASRPERIAELAARTGLTLEDLVLGQEMLAGPDNPMARDVRARIDAGDVEGARAGWHDAERLLRDVHDFRRDAISDLLGWIYREHGAGALEAAQLYAAERGWWRTSIPRDLALDPRQRLAELAFMLTVGAFSQLEIAEQEDRWVVHNIICGNCGRQVRDRYRSDGWGLDVVTEKGPMTFGQEKLTVYQTHLAIIHHQYSIDLAGAPWPAFRCAGLRHGVPPCQLHVFKDPAQTDAEFYESVGRSRP